MCNLRTNMEARNPQHILNLVGVGLINTLLELNGEAIMEKGLGLGVYQGNLGEPLYQCFVSSPNPQMPSYGADMLNIMRAASIKIGPQAPADPNCYWRQPWSITESGTMWTVSNQNIVAAVTGSLIPEEDLEAALVLASYATRTALYSESEVLASKTFTLLDRRAYQLIELIEYIPNGSLLTTSSDFLLLHRP